MTSELGYSTARPGSSVAPRRVARRAAAALTLITTCRKLGIDPKRYLKDALRKLLAGEKDLTALLPETFATNAQLPNSVQPKALPAAA